MQLLKQRCLLYLFGLFVVMGSLLACSGSGSESNKIPDTIDETPIPSPDNNHPPEAGYGEYSTVVGTPVRFNPPVKDDDGNIDPTSFVALDLPAGHTIEVNSNGKVTYTPLLKFVGEVRFRYSISDYDGAAANASIVINVNPITMSLTAESGVRAVFYKDGIKFYDRGGGAGGGRGFNIVVFNSITGELIEAPRNFDTWGSPNKDKELAEYINFDIPMGAIVMIVVGDSAGNYGPELVGALKDLGATQAVDIGWRHTWAMIAIKGQGIVLDEVRADGQWQIISATTVITLDVEDPHGDTMSTATYMELDNAELGYLYEGEKDMFWIDLPQAGALTLFNSKTDQALTVVKDDSGKIIASSLDYLEFADKSIKQYLESGIYYVEVSSSLNNSTVGSFVLKTRYTIDPPLPKDLVFTALSGVRAEFAVNGEIFTRGGRGFNIIVADPYTRHIDFIAKNFDTWGRGETAGNELAAYINGLADGSLLLIAVGDSAGNYGTALKSTLSNLGANMAGDIGWRHTWAMIAIKGQGIALDEVRADGQWINIIAESTINVPGYDTQGEAFKDAATLEINSLAPAYLHESDVDIYLLALTNSAIVRLESRGEIDTWLRLFVQNTDGDIVLYATEDQGGTASNFLWQESLLPGIYYIEISGHGIATIGQYDLAVTIN